jgi:hypothetical protein
MGVRVGRGFVGAVVVGALLCLVAAPALAKSIFLNGVNIDGVTNQTFDGCTVAIDATGNVLITAKGYSVETVAPATTPAPTTTATTTPAAPGTAATVKPSTNPPPSASLLLAPLALSKRYFLVSETNAVGMVQYDVDVFVNSVWIKRISSDEPQVVLEISRHLHKGKNTVHIAATKVGLTQRKSTAAQHFLKVHLGEGDMGGNNVMIDNPLLEYTRNASELTNFADDFTVEAR